MMKCDICCCTECEKCAPNTPDALKPHGPAHTANLFLIALRSALATISAASRVSRCANVASQLAVRYSTCGWRRERKRRGRRKAEDRGEHKEKKIEAVRRMGSVRGCGLDESLRKTISTIYSDIKTRTQNEKIVTICCAPSCGRGCVRSVR